MEVVIMSEVNGVYSGVVAPVTPEVPQQTENVEQVQPQTQDIPNPQSTGTDNFVDTYA